MKKMPRRPLYLIAEPRSGSSWLMHTLASHPEIDLRGELLNPDSFAEARFFRNATPDRFWECFGYLEKEISATAIPWSGCKILIPHLYQINAKFPEFLFSRIRMLSGRCLFLIRQNLLAARLSLDLAFHSGCWHVTQPESRELTPIRLDPSHVWKGMDLAWQRREEISELLHSYQIEFLPLSYETIFPEPAHALNRIADFLGIGNGEFALHPEVKANPFPLEKVLLNFSEVAARLREDPRFIPFLPAKNANGATK